MNISHTGGIEPPELSLEQTTDNDVPESELLSSLLFKPDVVISSVLLLCPTDPFTDDAIADEDIMPLSVIAAGGFEELGPGLAGAGGRPW